MLGALAINAWTGQLPSSSQILAAAPAVAILFSAGIEWAFGKPSLRVLGASLAVLVVVFCATEDGYLLASRTENVERETAALSSELTPGSCVVFVSQGFSKIMFLVFNPGLDKWECSEFFHRRILLAVHPYVALAVREEAESYFRGLNFVELKRMRFGSGEIVAMGQPR